MALCSCNEGGPRLTADATACEVPTITTPVGVMPEIVREGSSMPLMIWRAVYVRFWRTRPWPSGSALLVVRTWDQRTGAILEFVHLRGAPVQRSH